MNSFFSIIKDFSILYNFLPLNAKKESCLNHLEQIRLNQVYIVRLPKMLKKGQLHFNFLQNLEL
jgi:hypothetical protein